MLTKLSYFPLPPFVNPNNNKNRQGYQPRVNTRNQTYGGRNSVSRPIFNNKKRSQFHESIEQENDVLLAHATQRNPIAPG